MPHATRRPPWSPFELTQDGGNLQLDVSDNGQGFDPDAARDTGHQGLDNMRRRAEAIGGTLRVESHAGDGTRIIVSVPLPA